MPRQSLPGKRENEIMSNESNNRPWSNPSRKAEPIPDAEPVFDREAFDRCIDCWMTPEEIVSLIEHLEFRLHCDFGAYGSEPPPLRARFGSDPEGELEGRRAYHEDRDAELAYWESMRASR
jgi:hypothetical protein